MDRLVHRAGLVSLIVVLVLFPPAFGQTVAPQAPMIEIPRDPAIASARCILTVDEHTWKRSGPAVVRVHIENQSDRLLVLSVTPTFILKRSDETGFGSADEYWAPVDIVHGSTIRTDRTPIGKNGEGGVAIQAVPIDIAIPVRKSADYEVDASKLAWNRSISSLWPTEHLGLVVAAGEYKLSLSLGDLRCNKVDVRIEK